MSKRTFALALSGGPSSGKTTVAREVALRTNARRISFGDYVRDRARALGRPTTRDALQELGERLISELGPLGFCTAARLAAGVNPDERPVIWDGVRHTTIHSVLTGLYGSDLRLVYLDPPEEERRVRLATAADTHLDVDRWERDETEAERDALKERADLVCSDADVHRVTSEVVAFLSK